MKRILLGSSVIFWTVLALARPTVTLTPNHASAIYKTNEPIVWRVETRDDPTHTIKQVRYQLKAGGASVLAQGVIDLTTGKPEIRAALEKPGTILAEVRVINDGLTNISALAGVAVAPQQIEPSAPTPSDFDAFWKAKLAELAAVPENAKLTKEASGSARVDYWKVTLDNIRGTHIRGQLARPTAGKKFPAMAIFQYAGVYPLPKKNVTGFAADGWLVLNISAHDLPINEPLAFYKDQMTNGLANYSSIGNDDREKSYFLRMLLGCSRAVDFLSKRPDWDEKTLIVTGTSQGGLQSFAAAGLNPKVTGLLTLVPAGCDNTGGLAGRKAGWPYWVAQAGDHDPKKVLETSRYFDAVNFAARIYCPALVGLGLIDETATPSGVFAAFNQIQGPKEVVVMPASNHHGDGHTQAPYQARAGVWRKAIFQGKTVPIQSLE
ncbi:MAG: acetylxylan esterase [Verrucomicrobiota bacterium]